MREDDEFEHEVEEAEGTSVADGKEPEEAQEAAATQLIASAAMEVRNDKITLPLFAQEHRNAFVIDDNLELGQSVLCKRDAAGKLWHITEKGGTCCCA